MSRELPANPSLEYLRKEAKQLQRTISGGKLAEAQRALARDYGFADWAELKARVLARPLPPAEALTHAVRAMDAAKVRALLQNHPDLKARINEPLEGYGFGAQALYAAVQRSDRATIDVLLDAGAEINRRTEWWAGGFGVLDECAPEMVDFLVERGAVIDAHAAARLGMIEKLKELVAADPELVHARGGDGQTPLHFASTVEVARFLLEHGAAIDAEDVDHESTPAQYMLRTEHKRHYPHDRQIVARYLVERGCKTDILMASALGDLVLVRRHLERDPACIRMSVSALWFPKKDPRAGGTIYIWTLGQSRTAHIVAREFGHEDVFAALMERTSDDLKLALACELGDEAAFRAYLAQNPNLAGSLDEPERERLPIAAQSNNAAAVRLMLETGWPVNTPGVMGATALHWAGFNGNAEIARTILRFHPELELKSREHAGTALSWALFGSGNGWHSETGDFVGTVKALLEAGAKLPEDPEKLEPSDAVLESLP